MKFIKISFLLLAGILILTPAKSQEEKDKKDDSAYKFDIINEVPATSIKNQHRSGTCWSYGGLALLESELLRMDKGNYDLSEMWVVRNVYEEKADKYVRMHGKINFAGGGAFADVFHVYETYGMIPEENYTGLEYGTEKNVHGELDKVLKNFVKAIIKNKNKKLSTAWKDAFSGILDEYLGETPEEFKYKGKTYTPKSFADELDLNMDDYVNFTSYTHHPFYEQFILEIPDNWIWAESWNVPMDEMMEIVNNAMSKGYPVAWGADVSEKGFSWKNGVAIVPSDDRPDLDGLEKDKWEELSESEKKQRMYSFDEILPEKEITQKMRQKAFNNYKTTDDHGMMIAGKAKDQKGNIYYKIKNSWDDNNIFKGYFYASDNYLSYKTMNIVVHKDAIPNKIRKKLDL